VPHLQIEANKKLNQVSAAWLIK